MVKAYAIATVHRHRKDGTIQVVPASTAVKVSVFDADDVEFADLEKLGGVRKATKDEIALAKSQAAEGGNAAFADDDVAGTAADAPQAPVPQAPSSGAAGDPNSKPAKAPAAKTKPEASKDGKTNDAASKDDDLGV